MKHELDRGFAESILSCVKDKIDYPKGYDPMDLVISYGELEELLFSFVKQEDLTTNENQQETEGGF